MVKVLSRNIKRMRRLYFAIRKMHFMRFLRSQFFGKADAYILYPDIARSLVTNEFESIFILAAVAQRHFKNVRLIRGSKAGHLKGVTILYSPSPLFNYENRINYTAALVDLVDALERNGNRVIYSKEEILFWENKSFMYDKFKKLGLPHPNTHIILLSEIEKAKDLSFPLLLKEEHSFASRGLYKLDSYNDLIRVSSTDAYKAANENLILQELMNMKRDLRVIVIGEEVVLHYWRINPAKEWRPTSTSYGSNVDFITFPEQWRSLFIDLTKRLGLSTAAYDIAWQQDDTNSQPYVLEVSPSYQPNPPVSQIPGNRTYGDYKKAFMLQNSWDKKLIDILFDFKLKHITYCLNKDGRN